MLYFPVFVVKDKYTLVGFKFVLASDPIYKLVCVLRARGIKCAFCGRSISTLGLEIPALFNRGKSVGCPRNEECHTANEEYNY